MIMKRQKKLEGLQKREAIAGYLFILPFVVGFLVFMVQPLAQSLYMSFCDVQVGAGSFTPQLEGVVNYIRTFTIDPEFNRLLSEEISRMFINSLAIMVFSFFAALILNQKFKGRALVRAVFFLPVILSSGVIIGAETNNSLMASIQAAVGETANNGISVTGAIENILKTAGIGTKAFETVFQIVDGIYDVAIASGIQIIIFLSGLQTISKGMYEAADIEGCTAWEKMWKITLPMVSSLFLVNWIYTIVDFCMRSDNQVIEKIRYEITVQINYGFASAMSWIYFGVVIAIIGVTSLIISKGVYYYD